MQGFTRFLCIIPLLFTAAFISGQNNSYLKNFLTVEQGLSNNEVTSIVQDHDGFIWIGTRGGLNRYDGYDFKIFNQVPGDSNSLVNPSVEDLFVDSKGQIWIGTKSGGISKYDPVTEIFTNINIDFENTNELFLDNRYLSFYEDKNGNIWIGSWQHGLFIYDEEKNTTKQELSGAVNSIIESKDGRIWVGTGEGLFAFKLQDYSHKRIDGIPASTQSIYDEKRNVIWSVNSQTGLRKVNLNNNKVDVYDIENSIENPEYARYGYHSLLLDENDVLWVGTWGTGFYSFNPEEESFTRFLIYPENRATLNKDYDAVLDIFQDKSGNIWLGTNGGGVVVLTKKLQFNSIGYHPNPAKGLPNTRVMSVVDDSKGYLWLGTIGSGLFWSPDRENFFKVENDVFSEERFFIIKYIYEDFNGKIWVGSNNGTFVIEFEGKVPKMVSIEQKLRIAALRGQVVSFVETNKLLMAGLLQGGLVLMDKEQDYHLVKRIWKEYSINSELKSDRISALLRDSKNRIWAGTYNGLHVYCEADTSLVLADQRFKIKGELTGNIITTLDEDQFGNIWIGTPNGLNKLSEDGKGGFKAEYFTEKDGLASNFVKGITHDLNGNIWLSTNVGISKLETKENYNVINFNETDGIRGKNFTEASVFRNKKGEIFFGGTDGLTFFNPDDIVERSKVFKPVFTGLSILNQEIKPVFGIGKNSVLKQSISHATEIELSYRQNKIEIQFSALDFESNGENQYSYLLENHDKDWNEMGTRRFVIFNNLKPGEYILHVKSSNRHNIWSEEAAALKIIINPPFWQTWYALLFYLVLVVGIVTIIRWNGMKQVKLANNLEMEKLQHEQDLKINEMKLRFFTNLSHEFRTPLTLILAPLKELLGQKEEYGLSKGAEHKIGIIKNNSVRLMKLVNQLLDFRKVESGNMKVAATETNIEEFVAEVCHPFSELAKINNIQFNYSKGLNSQNIWVDRDKLEVILNNLLSNAFKIVKEKDHIEVALYEEEDVVIISVSDNGPGIPATEIDHIFDRFYRIGKSNGHGSSGIGLALVKRYVELHKGSISVVSIPNEHTEFIVSLKKGTSHFSDDEIIKQVQTEVGYFKTQQFVKPVQLTKDESILKLDYRILIVEDNEEVIDYLVGLLKPLYHIQTAPNGAKGLDLAIENPPALILSDVMMPQMDGFEFCKQIRANESTSTIPFIFLTAKSDEQFELLGTQLGADDFISKPFDPNLLLEKVKNTLERSAQLQKQYSKSVRLGPSEIEITSGEEVFIEKVIVTIEENLQNHKFSSDVLASEMNMSNSSLYRKLKSLTGSSTAEFIRSIRIKRAGQLLADKQRTITEIAYEVGFNDVKHFRTVFQKQFSCSPSEYRNKLA